MVMSSAYGVSVEPMICRCWLGSTAGTYLYINALVVAQRLIEAYVASMLDVRRHVHANMLVLHPAVPGGPAHGGGGDAACWHH